MIRKPHKINQSFLQLLNFNRRQTSVSISIAAGIIVITPWIAAWFIQDSAISTNLENRNLSPSLSHLFGTDWLGRDMFARTMKGLALSVQVGLLAAVSSSFIAVILGLLSAVGKTADRIVSWFIDLFLSVPHLVSLILIAFVMGGGMKGIVVGIALTHWPGLARLIRAEVMQLKYAEYVIVSRQLGKSRWWIATRHMLPHLLPQLIVGLLLLFPHAILHEAAVTFLGLGLSPHEPAIGIILSESMRYLSTGMWWLAFFPGLCLLIIVRSFDAAGENLRRFTDPRRALE